MQLTDMTNEVLAAILKSIDEGIHVVNTEGITIFYNEVAAKHDGLKVDEVLGKPLLAAFPSLNESSSTLLKVIRTKKSIYNQTQHYVNMHGNNIETINTTLPIFVGNEVIGAVEIAKDYSRMKLLAERLLDLQKGFTRSVGKVNTGKKMNYTLDDLMTVNSGFIKIKQEAAKFAKSDSPILVYGESGTGKELFVQGIHEASLRAEGPFIAQNCAAIPETLLESILFGTARGGYTGAVDRKGLFELADGGTLFLDELHTMPIELQAKLLRVIEDGLVRKVGSSTNTSVNVRVIAAMNEHPRQALHEKKLRSDLFYRLNVFTFSLLPLRERKEDILFLTDYFINMYNRKLNKRVSGIEREVELYFLQYLWPGNVRELKHSLEYMMNVCEGDMLVFKDLPVMLKQHLPVSLGQDEQDDSLSLRENLKSMEKKLIEKAMGMTGNNINQAAKLLEIPRQTLQYKIQKYNQ
ncbi:sigma 54-interacting transcriptional regulator [Neobacillus sp. PS3-34]|uniref:sigma-54 interaction domain-containing protein n=1 Tax=Neobacillus sp. PS3-34 TaxID=3070678 RepID=UPI0027E04B0D|nr:sigma 54-interacting transcriptional regulator [Neobacillus sp. PS3-34]WML50682.1 sigma 54-interacting transcriptional regulator [Neobacillus sp. PS3-34]